ncbi:MAG: NAD(P)-dependent dehydrogenase (short-subunit alcohol dehydrogenase family) [Paraglaciecola sp.]|jgi:NAD(P)-dependent dehydrogenase (short-subunit alcohol dehydrogenase family)
MKSLDNKIAFVTGGTTGIGRETAILFAKEGAKVVVTGRRAEEGAETVRLMEEAGGEGFFVQMDVKIEADIQRALQETKSRYGLVDIALNNAGVETVGPITDVDRASFENVFDINVWGVLASMKHEIPVMLENGGGSIINVSSVAGHIGLANMAVYIGSKHAVEGLTKVAALEYATQGIRVNAVAPAVIETAMADRLVDSIGPGSGEFITGMHPIGRFGRAREVAQAILFLASDASSYITGESLKVDGGFTAQ